MGHTGYIAFTVPGPPVPKERPRVGKNGGRTPARTAAYEKHVGFCALAARSSLSKTWPIDADAYEITLEIHELPKSRGDLDNYMKSILDGMQGILYGTDRRVRKATVTVSVDRLKPRAEVMIKVLE